MTRTTLTLLIAAILTPGAAQATPPIPAPPTMEPVEGGFVTPAQAEEDKARCTVRFVHATGQGKAKVMGPGLEPIRKALRKLPFKSFKLLSKESLTIPRGKKRTTKVPDGSQMSVKFIEKLLEGKETLKLRMQIKIPPKVKNLIQSLPNGRTWPGVVLPYKKDHLVIALTCRAK